ncbi:MAG: hemolysin family protein [Bacteroidia bacterium]|nr:hemolysin family protein [Bacteroidia bacterium]
MSSIVFLILMLVFSAFFSGSEMAYLSSNRLELEIIRKKSPRTSSIIDIFMADSGTLIATILVGNNIALVIYGLLFGEIMNPLIQQYITTSESLILLIQTIISTIIIIVTAEFFPKTVIQTNPSRMLNALAMPLLLFYILFFPIARGMQWCAHFFITKILRRNADEDTDNLLPSRIDLDNLLSNQSEASNGNVESEVAQEAKLMKNALDFGKIKVRDCAIPRTEIEAVDITESIEELNNIFIRTGYSKILVYEETIDNIIGYVHASSMFKKPKDIRSIMSPIAVVPETMEAKMLLKRFTGEHKSIALVVDEFGGTAGMVTLEDVLEEIFGEIDDEHDTPEYIEKVCDEGEYIFSGRLEIDYLNDKYNLDLPTSDDYDTIAGLILSITESIPAQEEVVETDGFEFKILVATQARIETIKLTKKQ